MTDINITAPGEKLLLRVWETLERFGIGVLSPTQIRREGKARADVRRYEALLDAQTRADVERGDFRFMPSSPILLPPQNDQDRSTGQRVEPIPPSVQYDPAQVTMAVQRREGAEATRRYLNLRSVARLAEDEALQKPADDASVSDTMADVDWLHRWREGAEAVSNEEVQRLWARVLVGEARQPGSFSLWTLDTLRSLGRTDAELFQRAARLAFVGQFIYRNDALLAAHGLSYDHTLRLGEMGVLTGLDAFGIARHIVLQPRPDGYNAYAMSLHALRAILIRSKDKTELDVPMIPLTLVGKELFRLGVYEIDEVYLKKVALEIKNLGVEVAIADWKPLDSQKGYAMNEVWL